MPIGKSIWLTYDWDDNVNGDVNFIAQELANKGLEVKLDRWNLTTGSRLWDQIASFIQDPSKSDAWVIYATERSLGNEKCREEFAYALNRALEKRGGEFPIIAVFPTTVDEAIIPSGIKIRLYVNIADNDWKERILASVEKRQPNIQKEIVEPFYCQVRELPRHEKRYEIEVRPHAGTWAPFIACVPLSEKDDVLPTLMQGPSGISPRSSELYGGEKASNDKKYWIVWAQQAATPTNSYYIHCKKLPSLLVFGVYRQEGPQYHIKFQ